jgi:transcriptional accessory protein Tex/SPT6
VAPAPATLAPAGFANGQYAFDVTGTTNTQYIVQASTDLVNWVSVQTNTAPFTYVDTNASQFNQRFYRTVSVLP